MYTATVDIYSLCVSTVKEDKECDTQHLVMPYPLHIFLTVLKLFSFRVLLKLIIFSECYCTLNISFFPKFVAFLGKHFLSWQISDCRQ